MKKVIISTILTAGILLAGSAQASNIDPVVESKLVEVCEAIKSDNLSKVNDAVKDSGVSIKKLANSLVCNGQNPVSFAMANDAGKIAQYMAAKSTTNHQELLVRL
jgi:hypothetical protein